MVAGIGITIAAYNHIQASLRIHHHENVKIILRTAIYRSKGKTLPDFSQSQSPAGDVFFDVRTSVSASFYNFLILYSPIYFPATARCP